MPQLTNCFSIILRFEEFNGLKYSLLNHDIP